MIYLLALMIFCSSFNNELTVIVPVDSMTDCTVVAYPVVASDLIVEFRETGRSADAIRFTAKIIKMTDKEWRIVAYTKGKAATAIVVPRRSLQLTLNLINLPAPTVSESNGKYYVSAQAVDDIGLFKTELNVNTSLISGTSAEMTEKPSVAYTKYYFSERIWVSSEYYVSQ